MVWDADTHDLDGIQQICSPPCKTLWHLVWCISAPKSWVLTGNETSGLFLTCLDLHQQELLQQAFVRAVYNKDEQQRYESSIHVLDHLHNSKRGYRMLDRQLQPELSVQQPEAFNPVDGHVCIVQSTHLMWSFTRCMTQTQTWRTSLEDPELPVAVFWQTGTFLSCCCCSTWQAETVPAGLPASLSIN